MKHALEPCAWIEAVNIYSSASAKVVANSRRILSTSLDGYFEAQDALCPSLWASMMRFACMIIKGNRFWGISFWVAESKLDFNGRYGG